jgi:hypothetical protein
MMVGVHGTCTGYTEPPKLVWVGVFAACSSSQRVF